MRDKFLLHGVGELLELTPEYAKVTLVPVEDRLTEPSESGPRIANPRQPSSMNEQPWSFVVATQQNEENFQCLLACLLEFNVRWARNAPVLLLSIARLTFASNGEINRHALHDVGQAMAHLTLQANASRLAVCQMAGFDIQRARETYSIPEDHEPVTVAAIGYPGDPSTLSERLRQKQLTPQKRNRLEDFVFEGKWKQPAKAVSEHK